MKGLILFFFATLFFGSSLFAKSVRSHPDSRSASEIISELDELLKVRHIFIDRKRNQADSLKKLLESTKLTKEKIRLSFEIANTYSNISTDSSIATLNRGFELAKSIDDSISAERFVILRAREYFFHGLTHECFLDLEHAKIKGIHPNNWYLFHHVSAIIYTTIGELNKYQPFDANFKEVGANHAAIEMSLLSKNDPTYYVADALSLLGRGHIQQVIPTLEKAISLMDENHELYHTAQVILGECYYRTNNPEKAIKHFALSSITEVKKALLFEVAILRLGEILTEQGDYGRAYNYLTVAFDNTVKANTRLNLLRVSNVCIDCLSHINKQKNERYLTLVAALVIMIILLLIIAKLIIDNRKEVKSLRHTEKLLARSNLAKDTYIGEFMNLCSSFMESLEEYNNMCKRKISTGQADSLLAYIKSGTILEEQRKKFCEVFDDAFLILFPDFVNEVNKLLLPDKQFPVDTVFNTELRILALTRLGIDDSATIARFLGISTNTIYTYRNKMRSRAIDRTTFDDEIKQIDAV